MSSTKQAAGDGRLRVLHCTISLAPGGRREAIFNLLRSATFRREAVSHIVSLDANVKEPAEARELAQTVSLLSHRSALDRDAIRGLRKLVIDLGVNVVHVHDAASQIVAAAALRNLPCALVMTFHRSSDFESRPWKIRLLCALPNWRSDAIITLSRERSEHYRRYHFLVGDRIQEIPHGIDCDRFQRRSQFRAKVREQLGIAPDAFVLGAIGHFGPEKGVDVVIKAATQLMEQTTADVHLVVLGKGTDQQLAAYQHLADTPATNNRVHFVGFQTEPEQWLSAFDLFLHGARLEAFGLVLAEAMAASCPVIATRSGGAIEVVAKDESGYLVDIDDHQEMAEIALRLLDDSEQLNRLSAAALHRSVNQFSLERCSSKHLALYHKVFTARERLIN